MRDFRFIQEVVGNSHFQITANVSYSQWTGDALYTEASVFHMVSLVNYSNVNFRIRQDNDFSNKEDKRPADMC